MLVFSRWPITCEPKITGDDVLPGVLEIAALAHCRDGHRTGVASSIVEYVSDGTAQICAGTRSVRSGCVLFGWTCPVAHDLRFPFWDCFAPPHSDPYRSGHKSMGAVTASPDLSNPTTSSGRFTGRPLSSLV